MSEITREIYPCPVLAQRVSSLRRINSVAIGARADMLRAALRTVTKLWMDFRMWRA